MALLGKVKEVSIDLAIMSTALLRNAVLVTMNQSSCLADFLTITKPRSSREMLPYAYHAF